DSASDMEQRLTALRKIGELGSDAAILVPSLVQIVADPSSNQALALESVKALGNIGPKAIASLPALVSKLMSGRDEFDRGTICRSITSVDPLGKRTIPLIMPALEDPFRARVAIELLDEIGTGESTNLAVRTRARWHMK